ncbi:MAG: trigger factor [Candidatus Poribacteria bacterium]|nr:trigger factor [Candidatus Poribacteria bacterium]
MNVALERLENGRVRLKIEIPVEAVNEELERNYRAIRTQVSVPGFRKGKVPIGMIKARFGDHINSEAIQNLVLPAYEEALSSELLLPLSNPEFSPPLNQLKVSAGTPLVFEATVDVKPSFNLPKYEDLVVDKTPANIPREQVDEYIQILQDQHATFNPIEEDRPVAEGDCVRVDVECFVDGTYLEEQSRQDADIELGKGNLDSEVESNIFGMRTSEIKEIEKEFDSDDSPSTLAGKHALYKVRLHAITEKQVPELDDEFSKDLGYEDYGQLFGVIWNNLVEEEKAISRIRQREEVAQQLMEKVDIKLPETLVDQYVDQNIRNFQQKLKQDNQTPEEAGVDMDSLPSQMRDDVIRQTKLSWIFDEIAKNEGIRVTDDELDLEIRRVAEQQNRDVQKYTSALKASNRLEEFRGQIRSEKIYRFLIDKSSAKESMIIT